MTQEQRVQAAVEFVAAMIAGDYEPVQLKGETLSEARARRAVQQADDLNKALNEN